MKNKILLALVLLTATITARADDTALLNVSYDVARNVYKELNPAFIESWKTKTGETIKIDQSHGGSGKQARAVIDGLAADVVSMNSPLDVDAIAKANLLPKNWAERLPNNSSPSWSTILFVVRKGNPKHIRDWNDLVKPGVRVIIPNPKTSGNGRYSYLAAWQFALRQPGGNADTAKDFVGRLFANVPVLDTGGRGATTTFSQRGVGDVLLTFENEVRLIKEELGPNLFDVVTPSLSVRANNPVTWVDKYVSRKGTRDLAKAYLEFHFSPAGQEIFAHNGLRPSDETVLKKYSNQFPKLNLFTVEEAYGSWAQAQATHFADGGIFDQIYAKR
jgi:sulfate transport system substrate-binding protein